MKQPDTRVTAARASRAECCNAQRGGRTHQSRVLGRQRQPQAHGQFEVARVVGRKVLRARKWQHVPECAPRPVWVDANVECTQYSQEFDGACLGDAPASLSTQQDVADLQRPQGWHMRWRVVQAVQQRPCRRRAFVIEAPRKRDRGVEYEAGHRRPSSRSVFHDTRPSVWCLANALASSRCGARHGGVARVADGFARS